VKPIGLPLTPAISRSSSACDEGAVLAVEKEHHHNGFGVVGDLCDR